MRYTVIWKKTAESDLAEIWMRAADQNAVTVASNRIDHDLAVQPDRCGRDMGDGTRYYEVPPLVAILTVDPGDRKVIVTDVWVSPP